jgi:hypothetical protein
MGSIARGFIRGRAGVAAAAWTPLTPGPIAYWDFSDTAHLWADTAGTVATTNAGLIARIDDKSGNGWHATQATAGNRPTRTDASVNSKTVGTFSSAGTTHLDTAAFTLTQPCTTLVWFSGAAATGYIIDSQANSRGTLIITTTPNIYAGATLAATSINALQHFVAGLFNGASSIIRLDGTETSGAAGAGTATTGFILGAAGGATTYFDGKICEVAIYPNDVGAANRGFAQTYGQAKWGTP